MTEHRPAFIAPAVHASSCKQAWLSLLAQIRAHGRVYTDQDGRACHECTDVLVHITQPSDALDLVREMQRQPAWVYPSAEELQSIVLGTIQGAHEYSYAPRLFGGEDGLDQVDGFIVPLLKAHPDTRRAVIMLYRPEHDSRIASKNVPGLLTIQFRVIDGGLALTCHIRSNDAFIGLPANIYQMRCLQEHVARALGHETGGMTVFSTSAHFFAEYDEEYNAVCRSLKQEPVPFSRQA